MCYGTRTYHWQHGIDHMHDVCLTNFTWMLAKFSMYCLHLSWLPATHWVPSWTKWEPSTCRMQHTQQGLYEQRKQQCSDHMERRCYWWLWAQRQRAGKRWHRILGLIGLYSHHVQQQLSSQTRTFLARLSHVACQLLQQTAQCSCLH